MVHHSMLVHCSVGLDLRLQFVHAAAATSGNAYWQPTLAIACSPLDAGGSGVIIDRHDRPRADFRDTKCLPLSKNQRRMITHFMT